MFESLQKILRNPSSPSPSSANEISRLVAPSKYDPSNPYASLVFLSYDPFFTNLNLDITRISDRILACGMFWKNRTEKLSYRNNIKEMSDFVHQRFKKAFMVWNLASSEYNYDYSHFDYQVISFDLNRSIHLSIKNILDICRSAAAWLMLDPSNVCIFHCTNGFVRTGLAIACLYRYCELIPSAKEAFDFFVTRRTPTDQTWISSTMLRYLEYFDRIVSLHGTVPNPFPLTLHRVILNSIPNFDGRGGCDPGMEIFQNGMLIYSSAMEVAEEQLNRSSRRSSMVSLNHDSKIDSSMIIFQDEFNIAFRLKNVNISNDIQIRLFHFNENSGQKLSMCTLTLNSGFLAAGVIRFRLQDLDIRDSSLDKFSKEFSLDLILSQGKDSQNFMSYQILLEPSFSKNLAILSGFHHVRPDVQLCKALELQGHMKLFAKIALQLRNNSIHEAHELLNFLSNSKFHKEVSQELVEMGRSTYKKIKNQRLRNRPRSYSSVDELTNDSSSNSRWNNAGLSPNDEREKKHDIRSIAQDHMDENKLKRLSEMKIDDNLTFSQNERSLNSEKNVTYGGSKSSKSRPLNESDGGQFVKEIVSESAAISKAKEESFDEAVHEKHKQPEMGHPDISNGKLNENQKTEENSSPKRSSEVIVDGGFKAPPPPPPPPIFPTDGIPPPPPPPPGMGLPPPPPLPGQGPISYFDDNKMRVRANLHWNEIRDQSTLRNSLWMDLKAENSDRGITFDVTKFEELFCVNPEEQVKKTKSNEKKKTNGALVLDMRRSNNVAIGLSRFQKRFSSNRELLEAILNNDSELLGEDLMAIKNLLPTKDESDKLGLFRGKHSDLSMAEKFMIEMLLEPNLSWILDVLIFERFFAADSSSIEVRIDEVTVALSKLRSSETLKILLGFVLELGNMANYDYGRGSRMRPKAVAFKLDSLLKLRDFKGKDGKTSLLNYLALAAEKSNPKILDLPSDFSELTRLKFTSFHALQEDYRRLQSDYDIMKSIPSAYDGNSRVNIFLDKIQDFKMSSNKKIQHLKQIYDNLCKIYEETLIYFGEEPESKLPEELFSLFDHFLKSFDEAIKFNAKAVNAEKKSSSSQSLTSENPDDKGAERRKKIASSMRDPEETIHGIKKSDLLKHGFFKRQSQSFEGLSDFAENGGSEKKNIETNNGPTVIGSNSSLKIVDSFASENDDTCTSCRLPLDMCECQY